MSRNNKINDYFNQRDEYFTERAIKRHFEEIFENDY